MPATLQTVEAALKDDYKDLTDDLNNMFPLGAQIENDTENIESGGNRAIHAVHVGRSSGVGARVELQDLPVADRQKYLQVPVPLRSNHGRIQFTEQLLEAMKGSQTTFVDTIERELDGSLNDSGRDRNRQMWGTSNGVIAQCGTTSADTTVVLNSATTDTQILQMWSDGGMTVDIGTIAASTSQADGVAVVGYDLANKTIELASAVTTTASHFVFRHGAGGATDNSGLPGDGQVELTGMRTIVDDTAILHTVNPATTPKWKAIVDANGGTLRAWSEALTNQLITTAERGTGMQVDTLWCNHLLMHAIANDQLSIRRNNDTVDLLGGHKGVRYSTPMQGRGPRTQERSIVFDYDCPEFSLFGLATTSLRRYVGTEARWMDMDGSIFSRVPNKAAYEATFTVIDEVAARVRDCNFVIRDLAQ